jgi:hypothetical protein
VASARAGATLLTLLCLAHGPALSQEPPGAVAAPAPVLPLHVQVIAELDGAPLGHSVVSLPGPGVERFTDAGGRVVLPVARAGRLAVRAKRLGFVPRDTTVEITGAPGQRIVVALTRVSFELRPVEVVAWPPCRRPGIPRRGGDAQLRGIVEQLRQNAERFRLLTTAYPFSYSAARERSRRVLGREEEIQGVDTIVVSGSLDGTYQPGRLVSREGADGSRGWLMHMPLLGDLAEQRFIDNHCFHVAGLEDKEGQRLLRLDIVAAERLRGPDVHVVAWLDPAGFQLRHATFTLSRVPPQFRDLLHVVSHVRYGEVAPSIPVMHETMAENLMRRGATGREVVAFMERQRIVRLTFHGERPDGSPPPAP